MGKKRKRNHKYYYKYYYCYRLEFIDSTRFLTRSLLIMLLKEFIVLTVNMEMIIKNVKLAKFNIKI